MLRPQNNYGCILPVHVINKVDKRHVESMSRRTWLDFSRKESAMTGLMRNMNWWGQKHSKEQNIPTQYSSKTGIFPGKNIGRAEMVQATQGVWGDWSRRRNQASEPRRQYMFQNVKTLREYLQQPFFVSGKYMESKLLMADLMCNWRWAENFQELMNNTR